MVGTVSADMTLEGCHRFWASFQDANVYRAICLMEKVEDWTLDNDGDVEAKLVALGEALQRTAPRKIEKMDEILVMCTCLRISRKLRFMQIMDQIDPGAASRLIQFAEQQQFSSNDAGLFLKRNVIFERMRMISRMISSERLAMVRKMVDATP